MEEATQPKHTGHQELQWMNETKEQAVGSLKKIGSRGMNGMFAFAVALLAIGGLRAQETLFIENPRATHPKDKTQVEVEALFTMPPRNGYLPVRVTIVNQRKTDGSLKLSTSSSSGSGNDEDSELTSQFELSSVAETATTHDLLVPVTTDLSGSSSYQSNHVQVQMSGSFGRSSGGIGHTFDPDAPAILMSETLHTPNSSKLDSELNSGSSGYGSFSFASRFDPKRMPEDWRAYCGFDDMLLTDTDWTSLSAGARGAILQWVRLGGEVVCYRTPGSQTNFTSLGVEGETNGDHMNYGYGKVSLGQIPASLELEAKTTVAAFTKSITSGESINHSILKNYSSSWPLHVEFGKQKFTYGIFIVVLIGFGVLVGPINLFVFAKSGMRHKLFITTPIISLATSALLILLILVKDGVGGRGMRMILMEVRPDQNENRAYMIQEQVSRTGVLVGAGFEMEEDAAISPVPIEDSPWARLSPNNGGGGMRYSAENMEGRMKISGDWFQSRSEQGQMIQSVIPTRGRIELKNEAGTPVLASTFEFPLEKVYYLDSSGGCWMASDLKAGNSVTATPIDPTDYHAAVSGVGIRLGKRQQGFLGRASERKDHFVAVAADAPAVETFDAIRWVDTTAVITGPIAR